MAEKTPEAALRRLLDETPAGIDLHRFVRTWNLNATEAAALWQAVPMIKIGRPEAPTGIAPARLGALGAGVLATRQAGQERKSAVEGRVWFGGMNDGCGSVIKETNNKKN